MPKRYRLYFDESGDHSYTIMDDPAKRYLGLTGVFVETEYYRTTFQPALEALKQKHFPHDPDEHIILHRKQLVTRSYPFHRLQDPAAEAAFNADLVQFLEDQQYTVITVVIDKYEHVRRYGKAAFHPYHYCMAAMLERYCGFLNVYNAEGDVMGESRGKQEDDNLRQAYQALFTSGTQFHRPEFFQRGLLSSEVKLKRKEDNTAGLQVADLLAHPCKQALLVERGIILSATETFGTHIARCIEGKYNRRLLQGQVAGYGKVFLR